jgi:tight adherence protein C
MTGLGVVRAAMLAGAGVTVTTLAYALAASPTRRVDRVGYRGLKRARSRGALGFAMIEPVVRWLGHRISGLVPIPALRWIDRQLVLSGEFLGLTAPEVVALAVLGFAASLAASALYVSQGGAPAAATVFTVIGALLPYLLVSREIDRRTRDVARGLPYVIDLLALSMSAGLDFPGAIRQVVSRSTNRDDALNEELERILHELAVGHTRREALESFADRTTVIAAREFVAAVVQSEQRGNPLAETLAIQAQVSRQQRSMRAETLAAKKAVAVYIPLMLLMVSVLLLIAGPLVLRMKTFME